MNALFSFKPLLLPIACLCLASAAWADESTEPVPAKPLLEETSEVGAIGKEEGEGIAELSEAVEAEPPKPKKGPIWWRHPEYQLQREGTKENNYGVLNLGQLKNMTAACAQEMEQSLPGGAGPELLSMLRRWIDPENKTNNYAVANTGQLKNVVSKFYDRLIEEGYAVEYPWANATKKPNHKAVANVGQLKNLFNFDIEVDSDRDGLSDMFELASYGSLESKGIANSELKPLPGYNLAYVDRNFDGVPDEISVTKPEEPVHIKEPVMPGS